MIEFIKSEKFILPLVYLIIGTILYSLIKFVANKISKNKYIDKKKKTIISLIKNILKWLVYLFVILSTLSVYGIDTSGIIASLGIAGLVIGLALQDIIADFVAGIFILFDDQYTIGDIVEINGFKGEVIKMDNVVGKYSLLGINEFSTSSIKYIVSIECKANCQYQIKRDFFKLVKRAFDCNNIKIPYNKLDVNIRGNK